MYTFENSNYFGFSAYNSIFALLSSSYSVDPAISKICGFSNFFFSFQKKKKKSGFCAIFYV